MCTNSICVPIAYYLVRVFAFKSQLEPVILLLSFHVVVDKREGFWFQHCFFFFHGYYDYYRTYMVDSLFERHFQKLCLHVTWFLIFNLVGTLGPEMIRKRWKRFLLTCWSYREIPFWNASGLCIFLRRIGWYHLFWCICRISKIHAIFHLCWWSKFQNHPGKWKITYNSFIFSDRLKRCASSDSTSKIHNLDVCQIISMIKVVIGRPKLFLTHTKAPAAQIYVLAPSSYPAYQKTNFKYIRVVYFLTTNRNKHP